MRPVRLRTLLIVGAAFLSLLGVAASLALYLTAGSMERNGGLLLDSVEGVRAAERVEVSILMLSRARQMEDSDPTGAPAAEAQAVRDARVAVNGFPERYISSDEERELLGRVRADVERYLQSGPRDSQLERTARLQTALASTRQLVGINLTQADEARDRNGDVDELGRAVAIWLAGALVIGSMLFLFVLRFSVDRPLAALRDSLVRFKAGAREERLPEQGPEELRQIASEFNQLADGEARRDRLQLEFLSGVAHDLRGPLNILKLSAQTMAGAPTLPPEDRIRASMGRVSAQVDRLARMVDDLLDRTRIEAGNLEMHLDVCDVRPLVEEVAELHRAVTDRHHLEVAVPELPVLVRGDSTRLVQVLTNLVSNAIKYSPAGGAVRVDLEAAGGEAVISVADEGVGVAPEDREHIFEPFHRTTHGEGGKIPGVGLGLSVSRRLVQAHGGRIEVESRPEGGSVFRVRLPITEPTPEPVEALPPHH